MSSLDPAQFLPCAVLPPISDVPVDGFGGSFYDIQFPIPVYNSGADDVYHSMSWHDVDDYYRFSVADAIERAVSFGICVSTLLNLVALTPQRKRKLPLHSFMCLALVFQIIRNATDMVLLTRGPLVSSYMFLTIDYTASEHSRWSYAVIVLGAVASCLAFMSLQACFFIQSCALMTWVRLHHNSTFHALLGSLVLSGLVALGFRIGLAVLQIKYLYTPSEPNLYRTLEHGTAVAYAVSIGGWSLVFLVSSAFIIVSRRQTLLSGNNIYNTALNLIAIVGLESFIVPIIFCILQVLPLSSMMVRPEVLVVPSVLFLLPIGTLFTTVHGSHTARDTKTTKARGDPVRCLSKEARQDEDPTSNSPVCVTTRDPTLIRGSLLPLATVQKPKIITDPFEVELAMIDDIDRRS